MRHPFDVSDAERARQIRFDLAKDILLAALRGGVLQKFVGGTEGLASATVDYAYKAADKLIDQSGL